jgi:aerobic carbon-monoxide dehydrogenase large subunit
VSSGNGAARFVGASVNRREDPRLLTGHGRYVDDVVLPGMLHAAFVRSPLARATISSIDLSAARAAPGVVAVMSGTELHEGINPFPPPGPVTFPTFSALASGDVRYAGDPVAVVVAESRYLAEDAGELVDVEYDPLPPVIGHETAGEASDLVHPELESNVAFDDVPHDTGDLDEAFARCTHVLTETFHQHRYVNVPMEPRGLVASWIPGDEELTVWLSCQGPHMARLAFSAILGLPENRIRVMMKDVGGGFGQKIFVGREEVAVTALARRLARPVKWIEDRQENLMASNHAREEHITVKLGLDENGIIQAADVSHVEDMGAYPLLPPNATLTLSGLMFPGPYRVPSYRTRGASVYTNTCARGAYRGPWMGETLGRECMIDIAARELGIDPAELRRRNMISADELPHQTATGLTYDRISLHETLEQALELAGYDGFRAEQGKLREEGRYLGIGISAYVEPTGMGGGPLGNEVATIRIEPTGQVNVLMGTASHGHSLETTMVQVVADQLGVPMDSVVLVQGDTASSPFGGGTAGSRSAVVAGNAARVSAAKLREKVLEIAGHLREVAPEDLEIEDGMISVKGVPGPATTVTEVAMTAYLMPDALPPGMEPGLENTSRYSAPPFTFSNATQICKVEVDIDTGMVTVLDFVISEDCGVMINPKVVDGQIAGGIAQGIGGVLLEHMPYDERGNPLAITFKDYLMPTIADVPDYRIGHIETPSDTPGGHKGTGEGGAIGAPAAVVNAVYDALAPFGVRTTRQPLTPTRVLELISAAASA